VFFGFLYETGIWRASQIRNSWVTKLSLRVAAEIYAIRAKRGSSDISQVFEVDDIFT